MKESFKKYGFIILALFIGILFGKYIIKQKTEIKTVEKIKYVEIFREKKEEKKNIKVVVVEKPDGTKTTTTTDTSTTNTVTNNETKIDSSKETVVKKGSGLTLGLLAIADTQAISNRPEYGATIAVPVFGSLKAQALVTTDKKVGLGLAIEF